MKNIKKIGVVLLIFLFLVGCSSDAPFEPEDQNPPATIKLILTAGNAYANLVNVPSIQMQSILRVKPGDSNNSWLIKKLRAEGTTVMPPNGQLSVAIIDSIAKWIDKGAAND
jgi:hypothetical protein